MDINNQKIEQFKEKIIKELVEEFQMPQEDAELWGNVWVSLLDRWDKLRVMEV